MRGRARPTCGLALALALVALLPACSSRSRFAAVRAELEALEAARLPLEIPADHLELRGAIHVHSHLSPDSEGSWSELLAGARAAGLDFVVTTEHEGAGVFERSLRGLREGILVVPGLELMPECSGRADRCESLLAIGLQHAIASGGRPWQEIVDEVNAQGALAFVAHPLGWKQWDVDGLAGLEIYDLLDDTLDERWRFPKLYLDVRRAWDEYPDEVFLQILDRPDAHLRRWDELTRERPWVGIAGNDAHRNVRVAGREIDSYARSFRFVSTHVWTWALDEEAVLSALADGHAFVAFDGLVDARGFWFATHPTRPTAIAGDTVDWEEGLDLVVRTPAPARIVLLRDGLPVAECECRELSVAVEQPGVHRAEAYLRVGGRWLPWILANPIYVRSDLDEAGPPAADASEGLP